MNSFLNLLDSTSVQTDHKVDADFQALLRTITVLEARTRTVTELEERTRRIPALEEEIRQLRENQDELGKWTLIDLYLYWWGLLEGFRMRD